jgi:hypothetical protein
VATTLAPKSTIRLVSWTVPSASEPGITYTVSAPSPDDPLSCDCKASEHPKTRGRCWHIKAVHSGMAGKPRVRVSVTPRQAVAA